MKKLIKKKTMEKHNILIPFFFLNPNRHIKYDIRADNPIVKVALPNK